MTSLLALALAACGGRDGEPAAEMLVEDSAGVRIVTYAGTPDSTPPFLFSAEPLYRHGSRPGDYLFQYISSFSPRGGRFLPDGAAVISDAETSKWCSWDPMEPWPESWRVAAKVQAKSTARGRWCSRRTASSFTTL